MAKDNNLFLTDAQLKAEFVKCEFCEEKPCKTACPCDCSAADFVMAAAVFSGSDMKRSAAQIMKNNPLGGVCGMVCPDRFCMAACVHKKFDSPVNIPAVQATIMKKAYELKGGISCFEKPKPNGKKVAVIGSGPAGLSAAATLGSRGYKVDIFEREKVAGGKANLIPEYRLTKKMLVLDIEFVKSSGDVSIRTGKEAEAEGLLKKGYDAVLVATGLTRPIKPGLKNEDYAIVGLEFLWNPKKFKQKGKVAVIGGGATAADCAIKAKLNGAEKVELIALEAPGEMPLTQREMGELLQNGIEISGRTRVSAIRVKNGVISGIDTIKVSLAGKKFSPKDIKDIPGTECKRDDIKNVIISIGARADIKKSSNPAVFFAGDCIAGPTTVVEASAFGKNAALEIDAFLMKKTKPVFEKKVKSPAVLNSYNPLPVSLETDFFGRRIETPFILSAAPPSDGYDQLKKAYEAGWTGGIMKTAFDNVSIHIPGEYMHAFNKNTYGNCDNVSGHSLSRVAKEVERLVKEYPDRLTMASTGGPVTGNDETDRAGWQGNTKKLENAGVRGIEYSLSCPQGGDGTEGDIVSQNAALTAKIIDWVMQAGNAEIPKLFKLTAAVTSISVIARAVKEVLDRYPGKKAGITLANTFPTLCFKPGKKKEWEEGIVVGMSGDGVTPISYLTLANVSFIGIHVSGNGGPMDYKAAMNFLALGVRTVQFCTLATKYGYGIIDDLKNGASCLMKERDIKSMKELIGIALPKPVTDFMALTPVKKISACAEELCLSCGNCSRCPYQAITLNRERHPETEAAKCIGCSICVQKCFSGALYMRERTKKETELLKED